MKKEKKQRQQKKKKKEKKKQKKQKKKRQRARRPFYSWAGRPCYAQPDGLRRCPPIVLRYCALEASS